ncbi:hypothetical protein [Pectobacterium versatile]|jgi:hypothetical protein|uniref:hypothetical protein n=1 Tax=Pectobacterium versatile TaxID=2488639 RepID=UPI001F330033|nr:hypothetical protein [Pectobacterium versatile]
MNSKSDGKRMIPNKYVKNSKKEPERMQPPAFPLGMRFGFAKDVCILDFLDQRSNVGDTYCFYSIALTKTHATEVITNLQRFIDSQEG